MKLFRYHRLRGEQVPDEQADAGSKLFAWADDPAANPIAPEDSDLTALADAYSRVQVALETEPVAMDRTRKNELWEEIMRKYPSTTPTPPISPVRHRPFGSAPGSALLRSREPSHPRATTRHQGSWQTALNIALVVVLLLGITGIVWNRDVFDLGNGNANDTRPQLAMTSSQATPSANENILPTHDSCQVFLSTPIGTPTIDTNQWHVIQEAPAPDAPNRTYAPEGSVDSTHATQLSDTFSMVKQCINDPDLVPFSVATSRYIWEHDNPNLSSVQVEKIQQQQHDASEEIARLWKYPTTLDVSLITAGPFYPLQPDDFHALQDGRIGAIVYKRTFPLIENSPTTEAQASFVPYFITFEKVDAINDFDIFKVDEFFPLCDMRGCPSGLVPPIIVNQPNPVPGSTPTASPVATPVGFVNNRDRRN